MPKAKFKQSPTLPDSRPLPGVGENPSKPLTRNTQTPGLPGRTKPVERMRRTSRPL